MNRFELTLRSAKEGEGIQHRDAFYAHGGLVIKAINLHPAGRQFSSGPTRIRDMATAGQNNYRAHIVGQAARNLFCDRLVALMGFESR